MTGVELTVGVVGGGRMGSGIAVVFLTAGHSVVVAEVSAGAAAAAGERIRAGLTKALERGATTQTLPGLLGRLRVVDDLGELPPAADLVIEAVPELLAAKRAVLSAVERVVPETCVIATNTSSLSVTELAQALAQPGRFLGLHFFNPVPSSALVEIVVAPTTDDRVLARATAWVEQLGKQSVAVRDSPGFATSRLGVLLGLEAIRMLEEGVADAAAIDRAMELGYRHPTGPLRSTDLVGLDVRLAIAEHLSETLGDRFTPPALLRDMVARGELGRKTGKGFYAWP
ncbi:MAG: 3-hydroxybutyryl-CoA dehydrogenase [Frankiales bacterium]|nr:3-hydroxybutyryl-CoA dehydrogenase [Frankiales bacterium]